jgi:hypothetical protein
MKKKLYKGTPTVKTRVETRIKRSKMNVFIPSDFSDIASYSQILRALKQLIEEKKIMRFGYGTYVKAEEFRGRMLSDIDYPNILIELFQKLNIRWDFSKAVQDYNNNISTQVPVRRFFVLKDRFTRKFNNGMEDMYVNS